MADDRDLMRRLASDDATALTDFYNRYGRLVYARAFVEIASRADAEEVLQDAFLLLWQKRRKVIIVGESTLPWLLVTARYLASNRRRARDRARTVTSEGRAESSSTTHDPAVIVARSEFQELIDSSLARLPAIDREVFKLCAVDGLSYKEAARRIGTTHAVVRNRLSRTRSVLRADTEAYLGKEQS